MSSENTFGTRIAVLGALVFLIAGLLGPLRFSPGGLALLLLLCLYGESRAVKLPGYGIFNPGEGFYTACACLYGPVPGALLALAVGLFSDLRRGKPGEVVDFNTGWALMTFSLVGLSYHWFGLLGAGFTYALSAGTLQAFGEHHFSHLPLSQTIRHQFTEMAILAPSSFLFAYLSLELFSLRSPVVLMLILPMELAVSFVKSRELSRELQQALRDLEAAQSELVATGRKAALGVMSAGIAHEINNPLAAAVTNIHMLKSMSRDKNLKPCLDLLDKSVARCQSIVARMLKYSRQSGPGGVPCQLSVLVEDGVLFCGRKFGPPGPELELDIAPEITVMTDPTEFVQIVSNLLSNAHDSGASKVRLAAEISKAGVRLSVSDNGSGIPDNIAERIFDPFFTTKSVGDGTGLGLSISQGLARGFGGDLTLKSSAPGATVFEVVLRAADHER